MSVTTRDRAEDHRDDASPRRDPHLGGGQERRDRNQNGARHPRLARKRRGEGHAKRDVEITREVVRVQDGRDVGLGDARPRFVDSEELVRPERRVEKRRQGERDPRRHDHGAEERHAVSPVRDANRRDEREQVRDALEDFEPRRDRIDGERRPARPGFVKGREGARPHVCIVRRDRGKPRDRHGNALKERVREQRDADEEEQRRRGAHSDGLGPPPREASGDREQGGHDAERDRVRGADRERRSTDGRREHPAARARGSLRRGLAVRRRHGRSREHTTRRRKPTDSVPRP